MQETHFGKKNTNQNFSGISLLTDQKTETNVGESCK